MEISTPLKLGTLEVHDYYIFTVFGFFIFYWKKGKKITFRVEKCVTLTVTLTVTLSVTLTVTLSVTLCVTLSVTLFVTLIIFFTEIW